MPMGNQHHTLLLRPALPFCPYGVKKIIAKGTEPQTSQAHRPIRDISITDNK
jgi:hypothetical protein